jgi:hypothetical protein
MSDSSTTYAINELRSKAQENHRELIAVLRAGHDRALLAQMVATIYAAAISPKHSYRQCVLDARRILAEIDKDKP